MPDGTIPELQRRCLKVCAWLDVNGAAIFGTRPWVTAEGVTDAGIGRPLHTEGRRAVRHTARNPEGWARRHPLPAARNLAPRYACWITSRACPGASKGLTCGVELAGSTATSPGVCPQSETGSVLKRRKLTNVLRRRLGRHPPRNAARVPRTEYSVEGHWELIRAVTGLAVDLDSPEDIKLEAAAAFMRAWNYGLVWNTLISRDDFGGFYTDMGHAEYAAGGVDRRDTIFSPFRSPEDVLAFDPWEQFGAIDRKATSRRFEEHYRIAVCPVSICRQHDRRLRHPGLRLHRPLRLGPAPARARR